MSTASRDVTLTIPAKPGYLVLARLALSAVCRLTALRPEDVADLKLAVTEAAAAFLDEVAGTGGGVDNAEQTVDFAFRLHADRLVLELSGPEGASPASEQELGRAIIEATVDEAEFAAGRTVLVKRLEA